MREGCLSINKRSLHVPYGDPGAINQIGFPGSVPINRAEEEISSCITSEAGTIQKEFRSIFSRSGSQKIPKLVSRCTGSAGKVERGLEQMARGRSDLRSRSKVDILSIDIGNHFASKATLKPVQWHRSLGWRAFRLADRQNTAV